MTKKHHKVCVFCGNSFESLRIDKLTCSIRCKQNLQYRNNKERIRARRKVLRQKNKVITKSNCKYCNNIYNKKNYKHLYCSRRCYNKNKPKVQKKVSKSNCKWCKTTYIKRDIRHLYCSKKCQKLDYCKINKNIIKEKKRKYRLNNIEMFKEKDKKYYKENRVNNQEYRLKRNKWEKEKYHTDPIFNLKIKMRKRLIHALKKSKIEKKNSTFKIIGCSKSQLYNHLKSQLKEDMNWSDLMKGNIHIDHIIPLASAKTEEEVYKLCHYTNLQPLWAKDNLKKGARV